MYLALHAVIDMAKISGTMVRDRIPDRFEVVGRVKLGPVAAPSGLLDDPVRIAQFFGRHAQDHNLADPIITYQATISTPSGGNLSYQPVCLKCSFICSTVLVSSCRRKIVNKNDPACGAAVPATGVLQPA